jgi:hypothetical protein
VELHINGGWTIFIDETTKQIYKVNALDKSFKDWVEEIEEK